MMFKMIFGNGKEMVFHEWNTLKYDLLYECNCNEDCLDNLFETLVNTGVLKGFMYFSEIRVIEDEEIVFPMR